MRWRIIVSIIRTNMVDTCFLAVVKLCGKHLLVTISRLVHIVQYWFWFPCGHIACVLTLCAFSACRLRYSAKGFLTIGGFSEPSDADADDIELWMPTLPRACNVLHCVSFCLCMPW